MNFDDLKIYLPKFLSSESDAELFNGLRDFPENIDSRIYTEYLTDSEIIYQGDGINDMLVVNIPDNKIKPAPSMIFSNTCDIDVRNERNFPSQVVYAPIFNLEKYKNTLLNKSKKTKGQIQDHITAIKKQQITQIFYLPKFGKKIEDSIVFFDRVCNYPSTKLSRDKLKNDRLFILSDYGVYIFLLKLSIHFTRIQDNVERRSIRI